MKEKLPGFQTFPQLLRENNRATSRKGLPNIFATWQEEEAKCRMLSAMAVCSQVTRMEFPLPRCLLSYTQAAGIPALVSIPKTHSGPTRLKDML